MRSIFLFAAMAILFAVTPVSPRVSSSGLTVAVDTAEAYTYRRARVATRRAYRRGAVGYGAYRTGGCSCY